jgi:hypothetical protein
MYIFVESTHTLARLGTSEPALRQVLHHVLGAVGTGDVVVASYYPGGTDWGGTLVGGVVTPETFQAAPDRWALVARWRTPADLPPRFRLVRLSIGADLVYPVRATDQYGWVWTFPTCVDHLALLAAHEGSHLVRPQLDEHATNHWALRQVWACGYAVLATLPAAACPVLPASRPGAARSPWRRRADPGIGVHRLVRGPRRRR